MTLLMSVASLTRRGVGCHIVLAVVLLWLTAGSTAFAESLKEMPPGPRPLPVKIGVYLIDFEKIDELTLTQTIVGYMMLTWQGPAPGEGAGARSRSLVRDAGQHLEPRRQIINQHTPRSIANWSITIDDEGW